MLQGDACLRDRCEDHPGCTDLTGWDLVAATQRGEQDAFGQLYDRYVGVIFGFILTRVDGDRPVAEDLTSETFLRALRRITSVRDQGRVGAWLVTIARNLVIDHVKSARHRLEITTGDLADVSARDHGPEHQVLQQASAAELMRAVAQLTDDQRQCVMLRFFHGLSVAQTAAATDRSESAVKSVQHRAIRKLAQLLPDRHEDRGGCLSGGAR